MDQTNRRLSIELRSNVRNVENSVGELARLMKMYGMQPHIMVRALNGAVELTTVGRESNTIIVWTLDMLPASFDKEMHMRFSHSNASEGVEIKPSNKRTFLKVLKDLGIEEEMLRLLKKAPVSRMEETLEVVAEAGAKYGAETVRTKKSNGVEIDFSQSVGLVSLGVTAKMEYSSHRYGDESPEYFVSVELEWSALEDELKRLIRSEFGGDVIMTRGSAQLSL